MAKSVPKLQLAYPNIKKLFGDHAVKQRTESRQFLAWFLENYYRLEETEVDDCICDGTDDKGLDGIFVNDQLALIDVFQSRLFTTDLPPENCTSVNESSPRV